MSAQMSADLPPLSLSLQARTFQISIYNDRFVTHREMKLN